MRIPYYIINNLHCTLSKYNNVIFKDNKNYNNQNNIRTIYLSNFILFY